MAVKDTIIDGKTEGLSGSGNFIRCEINNTSLSNGNFINCTFNNISIRDFYNNYNNYDNLDLCDLRARKNKHISISSK